MRPVLGRLKVSTRLMRVLFPAPEEPTRAVVEPAGAWKDTCLSTSRSATYWKLTSSKRTSPTTSPRGGRGPAAAPPGGGRPDSRVPARASEAPRVLGPTDAVLVSGRGPQARE